MESEQGEPEAARVVTVTRTVTEAWKKSARENGAKAKAVVTSEEHRKKLREAWDTRGRAEDKCNCGRTDGTHTSKCPAYGAWKQRESRARKAQEAGAA